MSDKLTESHGQRHERVTSILQEEVNKVVASARRLGLKIRTKQMQINTIELLVFTISEFCSCKSLVNSLYYPGPPSI